MIWDNEKNNQFMFYTPSLLTRLRLLKTRDIFYFVGQNQIHFDHLLTVYFIRR